ncbi:MAG TPA: hypothetical protein VNY04_06830 [Chthoniobacterales bacterium]|nr:hypothetical protein [Chthoniobacterales bacterium]
MVTEWRMLGFAGYEAIHMIRKGQACCSAVGAKVGLLHRFIVGMFGLEV